MIKLNPNSPERQPERAGTVTGTDRCDISVVVIARNEEATIGRCLQSVLHALASRRFELILVDSASTDRTVEIAASYPVRIVRLGAGEPLRPALGRHVGFGLSRAPLILFLDGDSVLDGAWLPTALRALDEDATLAGVAGASEAVFPVGTNAPPRVHDQYPDAEYDRPTHLSGSALYRREALDRMGGFNPALYACEEIELGARLRQGGYRLTRLRCRMTQHFPKAPKETVPELIRRTRRRYFVGMGQLARYSATYRLPVPGSLVAISRQLVFFGLLLTGALCVAWTASPRGSALPLCVWGISMATLFLAFAGRAGSFRKPLYYFLEWTLTGPLIVWGLLLRPRKVPAAVVVPALVPARAPRRRVREVLTTAALFAGAICFALVACEVLTRVVAPQVLYRYPRGLYVSDPVRGYKLAPGFRGAIVSPEYETSFIVNSRGLRDVREYGAKASDVFRILVLGDSFTAGIGVDAQNTFASLIERELNSHASRTRFEVINTGVPGYTTREEALYLKQDGFGFQPDLVLLAFFVGNDVLENERLSLPRVVDGELSSGESDTGILPWRLRAALSRHSHLYHLASPVGRRLLGRDGFEEAQALRTFAIYDDPATPAVAGAWHATGTWLGRLARACQDRAIPLGALVIPDPLQVDPIAWRTAVSRQSDPSRFDSARPSTHVDALLGREGVPTLDLLRPLLESSPSPLVYFAHDGHWTERGHAIAAQIAVAFLGDAGLVPHHPHADPN